MLFLVFLNEKHESDETETNEHKRLVDKQFIKLIEQIN